MTDTALGGRATLRQVRDANRKLVYLELFVLTLCQAAAKLPRYATALDMHASLAARPEADDAADVPTMRLAAAALREVNKAMEMVKSEATDMAKKLGRFSEDGP